MTKPLDGGLPSSDTDLTQAPAGTARTKEQIGPYRLLQLVGEGGMGEVWLAEQTRPVHRQVALKVIKAGMDTAEVIARFEAERQALALMDHTAIARVFDAGTTPEGRPYFVMEHVRGESITSYVTRYKLSIHDRIDLFMQVCEGVQHAHQKGIIHRDLKPSNILIAFQNDRPAPKIIDFGLAKAMTHSLTDRTLHTELGALVGTPEYMSPEQADLSGLDVDTRTDVYALGVILYELLTRSLPFDPKALRTKPLDEIRRVIREVDPPKPSTRAIAAVALDAPSASGDAAMLAGQLRGDLDWITMKAIEKDRARRYATVGDLSADLQRHLDDQPVLASPPSTAYRLEKFVRRNRIVVAATVTVVMLLAAFAVTMAMQARRIAKERDRANFEALHASREAEAAKQISDFLVGLFQVSDPGEARGNAPTARELLDKGARDIAKNTRIQPAVRGQLQTAIGTVYTNLGVYSEAEASLKQAATTLRVTVGDEAPTTLTAIHALANVYWYQQRFREAEPLYRDVIQRRTDVLGGQHPDTLKAAFDLASLYSSQKRFAEAEQLGRRVLEIQQRVLGADHPDTIQSLSNLQFIYYRQGRFAEAEPIAIKVLDGNRRTLGEDHPETLLTTHNLATIYDARDRIEEAEKLYLKAINGMRRVLGQNHRWTALSELRLGKMYQKLQRFSESEEFTLAAYSGYVQALGPQSEPTREAMRQLIDLYQDSGRLDKAAEWRAKLSQDSGLKR